MSRGNNFMKLYRKKSKSKHKGLRKGSFTPLQVERLKTSSTLSGVIKSKVAAGNIDKSKMIPETFAHQTYLDFHQTSSDQRLTEKSHCIKTNCKSCLPAAKEPTIIPETQSSLDMIDNSQEAKPLNRILDVTSSGKSLIKYVDFESHLPANKEPVIIAETQYSVESTDSSQHEDRLDDIVEKRSWTKSLVNSQYGFGNASDTNLDSDFQITDVISCTYVIEKKECGVADNDKVLEEKQDSGAAAFNISKPPTTKPTELAHADTKVLYANDDSLKNGFMAKLNESTYKPEKKEEKQLARMFVKMRHPVLPQHLIESTAGTHSMSRDEKFEFELCAVLKNGAFNGSEDEKIKDNWKTFCQDNYWDPEKPEPFLLMKHNGNKRFFMSDFQNRRNFVRCLAHDLPNRCLYSVYHRFRNLFGNSSNNTEKYTEAEDQQIRQYLSIYPGFKAPNERDHQYSDLAKLLVRSRASVWRRAQILKKKTGES